MLALIGAAAGAAAVACASAAGRAAWLAWTGACSRVLLQVHYASDVLAGLASGCGVAGPVRVGLRYARAPQALPVRS